MVELHELRFVGGAPSRFGGRGRWEHVGCGGRASDIDKGLMHDGRVSVHGVCQECGSHCYGWDDQRPDVEWTAPAPRMP